jgi:MFS family permease
VQTIYDRYPGYVQQVKRHYLRNYVLFIAEACAFTVSLAMFSQDTILPFLISNLTKRSIYIGIIPAIFYLGFYLPQILGAFLVHGRHTRKGIVLAITVIQRFATLLLALVIQSIHLLPDPIVLILFLTAYTIFSLTNGMIGPPYSDLINKTIIFNRGIFYGILTGVTGIIGFLSSLMAKYLLDHYLFPMNFRIMFWVAFGISSLSPFLVAAFREIPFPESNPPVQIREYLLAIPNILKAHPIYVRYLAARSLVGIAFMANAFYAVYAFKLFNLVPGQIGLFTMLVLISKSATGFAWGWLGDRFGYKLVMLGVVMTLFLQAFIALVSSTWVFFFFIAILLGSVLSAVWVSDPNMIFEIAPPAETGRFIGMTNTLIGPVMILAPLLGGVIVDLFSYQTLFWVCLVVAGAGILFVLLKVDEPRRVVKKTGE